LCFRGIGQPELRGRVFAPQGFRLFGPAAGLAHRSIQHSVDQPKDKEQQQE